MNTTLRLLVVTIALAALTAHSLAQNVADDEMANAPVLPSLAAMNQTPISLGTTHARVTQVSLMVNRDYPPGQPTVYSANRSLRLNGEFVADDPRRRSDIGLNWTFDTRRSTPRTLLNGLERVLTSAETVQQTRLAINRFAALPCYSANFGELPYPVAPGFENVEWVDDYYLGREAVPFRPMAEITVGGFLPASFFRQVFGPNGDGVLGVAYAFSFYDPATGQPTDIDRNGKLDTFWTEIYFNDLHYWGDATATGVDPYFVYDLETVALHEAGHTFGLGHFGSVSQNHGGWHVSPLNIMAQVYVGANRRLDGTPSGTFCGIYGAWL